MSSTNVKAPTRAPRAKRSHKKKETPVSTETATSATVAAVGAPEVQQQQAQPVQQQVQQPVQQVQQQVQQVQQVQQQVQQVQQVQQQVQQVQVIVPTGVGQQPAAQRLPVALLMAVTAAMIDRDTEYTALKELGYQPEDRLLHQAHREITALLLRDDNRCGFCAEDIGQSYALPEGAEVVDLTGFPPHRCLAPYRRQERDYIPGWDTYEGARKMLQDYRDGVLKAETPVYGGVCATCGDDFKVILGVVHDVAMKLGNARYKRSRVCRKCHARAKTESAAAAKNAAGRRRPPVPAAVLNAAASVLGGTRTKGLTFKPFSALEADLSLKPQAVAEPEPPTKADDPGEYNLDQTVVGG
jgi:hypothetical protein